MNQFVFSFEELPLVIAPGIEAALINGQAEIEYDRGGDWQVKHISVEGHRALTLDERAAGEKPWVYIPASAAIEFIILGRLNEEWFDNIQSCVSIHVEEDRQCAADDYADMKRDERMLEAVR